jgi:hypothetical protein
MLSNLAKNKKNTDSIIQLSTENFNKIDVFLREQNRGELSVLMLIGAWVEGMNMFCEIYNDSPSADISKRICEQKVVFDNVYSILGKLNKIGYFKELEKSFSNLKLSYDKIKVSYIQKKPIMKEENGELILKDQTETIVESSQKEISNVVKEIQKLRNLYFASK